MSKRDNTLEVWLDDDLGPTSLVAPWPMIVVRSAFATNAHGSKILVLSRSIPIFHWMNTPSFLSPN